MQVTLSAQGAWALYTDLLPGGKGPEPSHISEVYPSPKVSKGREAWSDGLEDPRKRKEPCLLAWPLGALG